MSGGFLIEKAEKDVIQLINRNISTLKIGKAVTGVKTIDLSGNLLEYQAFKEIGRITSLMEINLCHNKIKKADLFAIEKLVELAKLKMCSNGMTQIENSLVMEMENMREIDLSYNLLKDVNLIIFACFPNLEIVNLSGNPITSLENYELFTNVHKNIKSIIIDRSSFECRELKKILDILKKRKISFSSDELEECSKWKMGVYEDICCYEQVYDMQQEEFVYTLKIDQERWIYNQELESKREFKKKLPQMPGKQKEKTTLGIDDLQIKDNNLSRNVTFLFENTTLISDFSTESPTTNSTLLAKNEVNTIDLPTKNETIKMNLVAAENLPLQIEKSSNNSLPFRNETLGIKLLMVIDLDKPGKNTTIMNFSSKNVSSKIITDVSPTETIKESLFRNKQSITASTSATTETTIEADFNESTRYYKNTESTIAVPYKGEMTTIDFPSKNETNKRNLGAKNLPLPIEKSFKNSLPFRNETHGIKLLVIDLVEPGENATIRNFSLRNVSNKIITEANSMQTNEKLAGQTQKTYSKTTEMAIVAGLNNSTEYHKNTESTSAIPYLEDEIDSKNGKIITISILTIVFLLTLIMVGIYMKIRQTVLLPISHGEEYKF